MPTYLTAKSESTDSIKRYTNKHARLFRYLTLSLCVHNDLLCRLDEGVSFYDRLDDLEINILPRELLVDVKRYIIL